MTSLPLEFHTPMGEQTIVLRSGLAAVESLLNNAAVTWARTNVWGISVYADTPGQGESLPDFVHRVIAHASTSFPHNQVRWMRLPQLVALGFSIESTPPPPYHRDIVFNDEPTTEELMKLSTALSEPILNPASQEDRKCRL